MAIDIIIQQEETSDFVRLSASFKIHEKACELWFEIPLEFKEYLTERGDPFLLAVLFPAMSANLPVRIQNRSISKTLLRNIENVQQAWNQWKPREYSIVPIACAVCEEMIPDKEAVLSAFTGGVDGGFILWNNLVNMQNKLPYQIGSMLYVEGFHIPLREEQASSKLKLDLEKIATSLQIEFITIRTNLRRYGDWYDYHGTALASCLSLFKKKFNTGLLGSSHPYAYLRFPWGSNPVTDRLMSSADFSIVNYGAGFTRIEKIKKLGAWKIYQEVVNVCTRNYFHNCGQCEKCIRTLLAYKALDLAIPTTFKEKVLSPWKILTLRAYQHQEIKDYTTILQIARKQNNRSAIFFWLWINIIINKTFRFLIDLFGRDFFEYISHFRRKNKLYHEDY